MTDGLNVRLPREVLRFIDENKGEKTRAVFVVALLAEIAKEQKKEA